MSYLTTWIMLGMAWRNVLAAIHILPYDTSYELGEQRRYDWAAGPGRVPWLRGGQW